jgi:hypothetical protein
VAGLKLYGDAFAAVSPVDPHGLSGAPVLRLPGTSHESGPPVAIGVIRAVPRGSLHRVAAGGCLIATRIEDVADTLPEVAAALSANAVTATGYALAAPAGSVYALSRACWQALRENLVTVADPAGGTLTGWAHFFDEPAAHARPTAISTAYGLKLALVLDPPDGTLNRSELVATLWRLQLPDGGWAPGPGAGSAGRK